MTEKLQVQLTPEPRDEAATTPSAPTDAPDPTTLARNRHRWHAAQLLVDNPNPSDRDIAHGHALAMLSIADSWADMADAQTAHETPRPEHTTRYPQRGRR